jgi:hypothetical protein
LAREILLARLSGALALLALHCLASAAEQSL